MTFFANFGQVWHTLPNGEKVLLNDITKYITIPAQYRNDSRFYLQYVVKDGDRPDTLSYRLYGSPDYQWTVYLMNSMSDYSEMWPRTEEQLDAYISAKYPFNSSGEVHHYEDENGIWQDPQALALVLGYSNVNVAIQQYGLSPVTIYDYEFGLNESKRNIKLLDPDYIGDVERQLKEAFNA